MLGALPGIFAVLTGPSPTSGAESGAGHEDDVMRQTQIHLIRNTTVEERACGVQPVRSFAPGIPRATRGGAWADRGEAG